MKCTTCNTNVIAKNNFVEFACPSCNEEKIVRCATCKTASNKYVCSKCGFVGP